MDAATSIADILVGTRGDHAVGSFVLCAGVIAAYGADFLDHFRPWTRALAGLLLAAGAIDALFVGPYNLAFIETFSEQPVSASELFKQFQNPDSGEFTQNMLRFNQANIGITRCYEYTGLPTPVVGYNEPGYEGEQHLLGRGALQLLQWTPNALTFEVDAQSPTTIVINQNYDRGWKVARGSGSIVSHDGLLAVELPSGKQQLEVANRGDGLIAGFLITLVTAIGAALLWPAGCERRPACNKFIHIAISPLRPGFREHIDAWNLGRGAA